MELHQEVGGSYPVDRAWIAHGHGRIHVEVSVDVRLAMCVLGWRWWGLMYAGLGHGVDRSRRRIVCLHCFFTEMRRLIEWRWKFRQVR
jgi:hypothetical protein